MALNEIDTKKTFCGIIGYPLGHTLSPIMHNAAFIELGLNYEYYSFEIDEVELPGTLETLKAKDFRGLNVTIPYKCKIIEYLDELDDLAQEIGAVNTVVNNNGTLKGYNTDSYGAVTALRSSGVELGDEKDKVLIIGAGGGARAVGFGLAKLGQPIVIANRTFEKGVQLAMELNKITSSKAIKLSEIVNYLPEVKILINCCPLGMQGQNSEHDCAIPISSNLIRSDMVVFDIVYTPMETPLLQEAKNAGATLVYGYAMLVHQGAKSFELWTGKTAPLDVMREAVVKELNK